MCELPVNFHYSKRNCIKLSLEGPLVGVEV